IFAVGEQAVLVWKGRQFDWSFTGYRERISPCQDLVEVLTPRPIVALFDSGLAPALHESAVGLSPSSAPCRATRSISTEDCHSSSPPPRCAQHLKPGGWGSGPSCLPAAGRAPPRSARRKHSRKGRGRCPERSRRCRRQAGPWSASPLLRSILR